MDYSEVNAKFAKRIRRINVSKDGNALVVFSDGSAGVFKTPEDLEKHLEEKDNG